MLLVIITKVMRMQMGVVGLEGGSFKKTLAWIGSCKYWPFSSTMGGSPRNSTLKAGFNHGSKIIKWLAFEVKVTRPENDGHRGVVQFSVQLSKTSSQDNDNLQEMTNDCVLFLPQDAVEAAITEMSRSDLKDYTLEWTWLELKTTRTFSLIVGVQKLCIS
ncbi:hypothetical protein BC830DRAFT_168634 [Chytriomyces sp. MP71]|nr:hypothetical protein BC830DRAFT_168634 [Chytriomyces sp. MP71]